MGNIIEIECPECHSKLWIDVDKKAVIQHEKSKKKNFKSFDSLLQKEKDKKEKVDERFQMASELEKKKKEKAQELFEKSLESNK